MITELNNATTQRRVNVSTLVARTANAVARSFDVLCSKWGLGCHEGYIWYKRGHMTIDARTYLHVFGLFKLMLFVTS